MTNVKTFKSSNFNIVSKFVLRALFFLFSLVYILYILLPTPNFPNPPQGALQSNEPADTETPLREAYFTNFTREEVMDHYVKQLEKLTLLNLALPTYRLNYPPEEAQVLIRDQTRSTFLEEVVHPFRESLFINGFEPRDPKDAIEIQEKIWRQKITVKYVPSSLYLRLIVAGLTLGAIYVIFNEYTSFIKVISKHGKKN